MKTAQTKDLVYFFKSHVTNKFLFSISDTSTSDLRGHGGQSGGNSGFHGNKPGWLPRNSLNLVSATVTAVMLLACVFLRRTIARLRGLNVDNRELELTSNCTIPGKGHFSSENIPTLFFQFCISIMTIW